MAIDLRNAWREGHRRELLLKLKRRHEQTTKLQQMSGLKKLNNTTMIQIEQNSNNIIISPAKHRICRIDQLKQPKPVTHLFHPHRIRPQKNLLAAIFVD